MSYLQHNVVLQCIIHWVVLVTHKLQEVAFTANTTLDKTLFDFKKLGECPTRCSLSLHYYIII